MGIQFPYGRQRGPVTCRELELGRHEVTARGCSWAPAVGSAVKLCMRAAPEFGVTAVVVWTEVDARGSVNLGGDLVRRGART